MADITAIILTRNEEKNIKGCIEAVRPIVKKIVVVDSFSEDRTVEIAEGCGALVYRHEFVNYAKQYMYAVDIADVKTRWILRIDADEYLTEESARELDNLCRENDKTDVNGIVLRFRLEFMGRGLKHGGLYPWRKLSLYKAGKGGIENREMDEHIILYEGQTVNARKDSRHLIYKDLNYFISKFNWYSTREAMDYFNGLDGKGKGRGDSAEDKVNFKTWIKMNVYYKLPMGFRAKIYYMWRYYLLLGFLDGREGKIYIFLQSYWYRFLVDAKIYEHEKVGLPFAPTGALRH